MQPDDGGLVNSVKVGFLIIRLANGGSLVGNINVKYDKRNV